MKQTTAYRNTLLGVLAMLLLFIATEACAVEHPDDLFTRETASRIESLIEEQDGFPVSAIGVERLLTHESLLTFYRERDFLPLWQQGRQLSPSAEVMMEFLRGASEHGLCGDSYLLTELEGLMQVREQFARHSLPLAPFNRAVLDLFLSQAFFSYATHLVEGQVDPALAHVDWRARRRKADLSKLLTYAVEKNRLSQVLDNLMPPHAGYRQLVDVLQSYREIAALGGWPEFPVGPTLRPGQEDERLPVLRKSLWLTGDLELMTAAETLRYDRETVRAVRHYQSRHGLVPDGVIGPKTVAVLNVSVEQRIRQLELNLERWRWLPKSLGERHLRVNIADFSLQLIENERSVMTMPVIVGTTFRKTPVFSARMTYLEFAPHWTVPPTILREDKLPKIKANPDYLQRRHFRILRTQDGELVTVDPDTVDWRRVKAERFPGILRMDPGPWNPLGRVKFMFPNGFNVYLHDTNEPGLFRNGVRSFSSGCIRVLRPIDLAQYLLEQDEDWDCDRILDYLELKAPEKVSIDPIAVHIQYWTAWVAEDGSLQFRDDIYLRDLDLEVALSEPAYRTSDQLVVRGSLDLTAKLEVREE
jgi:murein L,D-transpeptidase YcbB/YkuD